jgi:hypothetical protein
MAKSADYSEWLYTFCHCAVGRGAMLRADAHLLTLVIS